MSEKEGSVECYYEKNKDTWIIKAVQPSLSQELNYVGNLIQAEKSGSIDSSYYTSDYSSDCIVQSLWQLKSL